MGVIPSAETFLYTALGFLLFWVFQMVAKAWNSSVEKRRAEVDELSTVRSENRKLKESLHEHRVLMLKSGLWTQDSLPAFIKE